MPKTCFYDETIRPLLLLLRELLLLLRRLLSNIDIRFLGRETFTAQGSAHGRDLDHARQ